jgi:hypothetical protein
VRDEPGHDLRGDEPLDVEEARPCLTLLAQLLAVRFAERMVAMGSQPKGGEGVDSERELILEDARSISQGLWRMARLAQDAATSLDGRIEDEDLDGLSEAV